VFPRKKQFRSIFDLFFSISHGVSWRNKICEKKNKKSAFFSKKSIPFLKTNFQKKRKNEKVTFTWRFLEKSEFIQNSINVILHGDSWRNVIFINWKVQNGGKFYIEVVWNFRKKHRTYVWIHSLEAWASNLRENTYKPKMLVYEIP